MESVTPVTWVGNNKVKGVIDKEIRLLLKLLMEVINVMEREAGTGSWFWVTFRQLNYTLDLQMQPVILPIVM